MLNLGSTIGYWTIGIGLFSGGRPREAMRQMLTPTPLALALALLLR